MTIYGTRVSLGEIYWSDFPTILFLLNLRDPEYVFNYREMADFYDDCASGDLANYTFLEPRWFNFWEWDASDQHPPHSVQQGEYLLASIYNAVRSSPKWNKTLLIITYDEHGGKVNLFLKKSLFFMIFFISF